MIRDLLNLTSVQVGREVYTLDGTGGGSTTTTLTTLSRAALWQLGGSKSYISEKIAQSSTHLLAVEPATYTWASTDSVIVYGSETYRITAHVDDVGGRSELYLVALERVL